jgi:hypothetical protein
MMHGRSWKCHVFEVPTREASVNCRVGKESNVIKAIGYSTSRTVRSIGEGCRQTEVFRGGGKSRVGVL